MSFSHNLRRFLVCINSVWKMYTISSFGDQCFTFTVLTAVGWMVNATSIRCIAYWTFVSGVRNPIADIIRDDLSFLVGDAQPAVWEATKSMAYLYTNYKQHNSAFFLHRYNGERLILPSRTATNTEKNISLSLTLLVHVRNLYQWKNRHHLCTS